jgi:hypothetical protein
LSEVPGGSLLITGGGYPVEREVVRIDARREFAVTHCAPMLSPRKAHAAVYHAPHLYILGGSNDSSLYIIGELHDYTFGGSGVSRDLSECERYVCAEDRWEVLPPLPRACSGTSGVVVENSLYALGGHDGTYLDLVQRMSFESLTWEIMLFRLPFAGYSIPCFKVRDTEVYLVFSQTLCSFTALEVRPLKTLTEGIHCWYGASYYHRGTLYCSRFGGPVESYEIGSLSN